MKLFDVSGISPDIRTFQPSNELVLPTAIIGIEIEAENVTDPLRKGVKLWEVVNDPSLRNGGNEFITKPLFGEDLIAALSEFEGLCNTIKVKPRFTWRTSVHIHMDVRDMDLDTLNRLLVLYIIVENHLFSYCDPLRWDSIYCLPVIRAPRVIYHWGKLISSANNKNVMAVRQAINAAVKYQALNLLPIMKQGSIEFRHLQGTYKKDTILLWINLLLSLKKTAINLPTTDWISLVSTEGIDHVLNIIFGSNLSKNLGIISTRRVFSSIRLAQEVITYSELVALQSSLIPLYDKIKTGEVLSGFDKYRRKIKTTSKKKEIITPAVPPDLHDLALMMNTVLPPNIPVPNVTTTSIRTDAALNSIISTRELPQEDREEEEEEEED